VKDDGASERQKAVQCTAFMGRPGTQTGQAIAIDQ